MCLKRCYYHNLIVVSVKFYLEFNVNFFTQLKQTLSFVLFFFILKPIILLSFLENLCTLYCLVPQQIILHFGSIFFTNIILKIFLLFFSKLLDFKNLCDFVRLIDLLTGDPNTYAGEGRATLLLYVRADTISE